MTEKTTSRREFAVTITAREQAELLPIPRDAQPLGPQEVAGRTRVTVISAGTELASAYQGNTFPRVPGYAAVFEVEAVGADITDVHPGDLAFCMGPHRSYQRVPRDQLQLLPEGLAPEVAVFARMMNVSMTTLTTATARPPSKVLVTGLGLVGHLAAKIFAACGYEVYACDPVASRRDMARASGIQHVSEAVPLDDPEVAGQIALALECSGHEQALLDACNVVCKRGEVVCIATPWKQYTDLHMHDLHRAIFFKYVVVRSGWEWELPRHTSDFHPSSIWGNCAGALKWLKEGRVKVDGIYTKRPPREAQGAYQDLLHKRGERLAVLFDWSDIP